MVEGCRALRNPKINEQIEKLNTAQFNKEFIKKSVIQKYIDIAFADISDYVTFGRKEIEVDKDEEGNPVMIEVNYVDFKNSNEVNGKPGINLIIRDFSKNIESIFRYVDSDSNASWAFHAVPLNSNYKKLENNCSHAINKRNGGNVFTPGTKYKITAKGDSNGVEVCKRNIVLTAPKLNETPYKVQVGAFGNKEYAEELKSKGYEGFITK